MSPSSSRLPLALRALPLLCGLLLAPVPATAEDALTCAAPASANRFELPLARLGERLAAGLPVTIVAIGSSSTAGAGASSSAASYPSRLEAELRARFPHADIRVLNRGVGGEETADMMARFDKAVIAERPDLVLWQVGTNSLLRDRGLAGAALHIHEGISQLKASGAEIVLIDPQFAPKVIVKQDVAGMLNLLSAAAKTDNVNLFRRFTIMRHWWEVENISFEAFLSPDGLHMNDWSYACWAKLLAGAIAEAATRATTVAGVPETAPRVAPSAP